MDLLNLAMASRHFEILQDSLNLINSTVYPKTFFGRYKDALEDAEAIMELCGNSKTGKMAENIYNKLTDDKTQIVNDFLRRCNDAGKLQRFKADMELYLEEMPQDSIELFENLLK